MACNQHFQFPDISFAYCYAFLFLLFHKIYNLCYPQLVGAIAFDSGRHQSKNIYEIIKNFSGWNRSVFDLLHFRDWFQIKMNLNRNVSCFIAVYVSWTTISFIRRFRVDVSSSVMSRYSYMDSTHCLASTASQISSARCFLPFSTFAFSSACSLWVFSRRRLKFDSAMRPATMSS